MNYQTLKNFQRRRAIRKIKDKRTRWMRYFTILLMTLMFTLAWCAPTQGKNEYNFNDNNMWGTRMFTPSYT